MIKKNKIERRQRIKKHIRLQTTGTGERPRFTVYKSLRHVYAQIVDDTAGKTLVAVSDLSKDLKGEFKDLKGQAAVAKKVGMLAAKKAGEKNISRVVFDRNGYLYHGVVRAVAEGAREGGLKF